MQEEHPHEHQPWNKRSQEASDLDLGQVEDLREDCDVIGVRDERVQSFAAGHSGGDGLELVPA